jgi:hypothetical protein
VEPKQARPKATHVDGQPKKHRRGDAVHEAPAEPDRHDHEESINEEFTSTEGFLNTASPEQVDGATAADDTRPDGCDQPYLAYAHRVAVADVRVES